MSEAIKTNKLDRAGIGRIITVLGSTLLFGAILFVAAGRLNWPEAWIFLGISLAGIMANGLWSIRHNPEMLNERGRMGKNAKSWDKVIGLFYMFFLFGIYILAGLDVRFGWSQAPLWVKILGGIALALSLALTFWVMKVNAFLSTFVRIQDERGHTTVSSGPYRFVRHPMYAGGSLLFIGMPLALGSYWGLLAFVAVLPALIWRLLNEEKFLAKNLPGYADYCARVRWRLIPGVF